MLLPPACRASYPAADDAWTEHPDSSLVCVIEIGLNPPQCVGRSGPVNAHGRVVVSVLVKFGDYIRSVAPCNLSAEVVLESSVDESVRVGRWRLLVGEPVLGGESVDVVVVDPPLAADEFGEARRRPGLTGFGVNPPAGRIVPGASVVDEGPGASGGGDVVGVGGIDLDVVHRPGAPGGPDADHAGGGLLRSPRVPLPRAYKGWAAASRAGPRAVRSGWWWPAPSTGSALPSAIRRTTPRLVRVGPRLQHHPSRPPAQLQ